MILSRLHRRLAALAAVLAISLQAFWPLIAQAQPRVAGELVPVCTVNGITHYLELPAGKAPLDERSATHGEHCKLCMFGSAKVDVVLPSSFALLFLQFSPENPNARARFAPDSRDLICERPRGPPAIS
ncbi:MAG TPA: DUF2946 family protein [Burkholderiales bacterium]|jgi:hypothetical protein|nr:DUF2946 family protein [Burkholderiales bacterium]